jgi:hypothetical protein
LERDDGRFAIVPAHGAGDIPRGALASILKTGALHRRRERENLHGRLWFGACPALADGGPGRPGGAVTTYQTLNTTVGIATEPTGQY